MSEQAATKSLVIERTFEANINLIWQLWTDPEHFKHWFGPQGFTIPVAKMDVQVGGKRLVGMTSPDGNMTFYLAGEFTEINPVTRLAYTEFMSDENGNQVTMPGNDPGKTLIIVELEARGNSTKMTMTHEGLPADSPGASGWTQAFAKFTDYLATL